MLADTTKIKKWTFRYLVMALFISFLYDILWLGISASAYSQEDTVADSGMEKSLRKFSLTVSVISFLFRVTNLLSTITFVLDNSDDCVLEGFHRLPENN
jgi:hypothetical protein